MPGFDRTGPSGQGPRTGRQMGKCGPKKSESENQENLDERPGFGRRAGGRGPGRRRGRGRGFGDGRGFGRGRDD